MATRQADQDISRIRQADQDISRIREEVVGMYSAVPWPGVRRSDEEMGWRLRVLGIRPEDYLDKDLLEVGCGTGDYALWYASQGARNVVGVDLSDGSLARAREQAQVKQLENATFLKQDAFSLAYPDDTFDYSFSVGVLHHTGDPYAGFQEMVRVTKPGGVIILSLYNRYSRFLLNGRQRICKWLGGEDLDARARLGERLFPRTARKLVARYHGLNTREVLYDSFACPHESLHSATEVLGWFDQQGVRYMGSFAPLRIQDYLYAFSLPEYQEFRRTFEGFPGMRLVGDALEKAAALVDAEESHAHSYPGRLNRLICQLLWIPFGLRISCFTVAGRKE